MVIELTKYAGKAGSTQAATTRVAQVPIQTPSLSSASLPPYSTNSSCPPSPQLLPTGRSSNLFQQILIPKRVHIKIPSKGGMDIYIPKLHTYSNIVYFLEIRIHLHVSR